MTSLSPRGEKKGRDQGEGIPLDPAHAPLPVVVLLRYNHLIRWCILAETFPPVKKNYSMPSHPLALLPFEVLQPVQAEAVHPKQLFQPPDIILLGLEKRDDSRGLRPDINRDT